MKHKLKPKGSILAVLLLCVPLSLASPAYAFEGCDYASLLKDQIEKADAIFEGHVIKKEHNSGIRSSEDGYEPVLQRTTIFVDKAYKGVKAGDTITLLIDFYPFPGFQEREDWTPKEGDQESGLFALPKANKKMREKFNLDNKTYSTYMCDELLWPPTPENLKLVPAK